MLIKHRGIEKIKRGKCLSRINLELVNTTHAESLRYWKQNYEVQITQPFCEVSYLSHREPKAACAARLTPDSPGLGPGGGRGWGGGRPSSSALHGSREHFQTHHQQLCTALDTCKSFVLAAFLLAYGLSTQTREDPINFSLKQKLCKKVRRISGFGTHPSNEPLLKYWRPSQALSDVSDI